MTGVRWEGLAHQEIWDRVMTGPGHLASSDAEGAWIDAEIRLKIIDQRLAAETARIAGGWEGTAAEATRDGLTPLGAWVLDATASARNAADALNGQQEQVVWVRSNLPRPDAPVSEQAPISLNDPGLDPYFLEDWQAADVRRTELADQAVHVMNTYTANSTDLQHTLLAPWSTPPVVTVDVASTAPAGVGSAAAGSGTAAGAGGSSWAGVGGGGGTGGPWFGADVGASAATASGTPGGAVPGRADGVGSAPGAVPVGAAGTAIAGRGPTGGTEVGRTGIGAAGRGDGAAPGGTPGVGISPAPGRTTTGPGGGAAAFRPVVPRAPERAVPPPSWRTDPTIGRGAGTGTGSGTGSGIGSRWAAEAGGSRAAAGGAMPGGGPSAAGPRPWAESTGGRGAVSFTPGEAGTGTRAGTGHSGVLPIGAGAGTGAGEREHSRPSYLVDDSDAFADDRWVSDGVITPDNGPPPRR